MPQEFKAIVTHWRDASVYKEIQEHDGIERAPVRTLRGAEFTILSIGPCPWPPYEVLQEQVIVFGYSEFKSFLSRAVEALYGFSDEHNFGPKQEAALGEMRELFTRLFLSQRSHPVPPASQSPSDQRADRSDRPLTER